MGFRVMGLVYTTVVVIVEGCKMVGCRLYNTGNGIYIYIHMLLFMCV